MNTAAYTTISDSFFPFASTTYTTKPFCLIIADLDKCFRLWPRRGLRLRDNGARKLPGYKMNSINFASLDCLCVIVDMFQNHLCEEKLFSSTFEIRQRDRRFLS